MKLREIILDFTSLLDVIMIILFWFILNYQSETAKIREKANAAEQAAIQTQMAAEDLMQTAQDKLDAMENINSRQKSILSAMMEYREGRSLNLTLVSKKQYWYLDVSIGEDEHLGTIYSDDSSRLGLELNEMLGDAGYAANDTVFCVLSYDSSEPGSYDAYEEVTASLHSIQLGNNQFNYTEINRSVPAEPDEANHE